VVGNNMNLSDVSKTAIITLRSHALESQKDKPILKDPMAKNFLDKLRLLAPKEKLFTKKLLPALTNHISLRARKYDSIINDFISKNKGTVINLGCGFDTRYWRINNKKCRYIELDLPEIVKIKKKILGKKLNYKIISGSVLDPSWIDKVTSKGNQNFLLIAEGLFMYLPKAKVISLFKAFSKGFCNSQIVLEVATEKYARGVWKRIVEMKMKRQVGVKTSYKFGIKDAHELESYANGIKVIDEWSYVEDPDMHPKILKYLGVSRTQWTVVAEINKK
jgi:methyltransferase (TIGR00027 family)